MEEYTIYENGKNILPFIKIPPEFENINLEITIKPMISKKSKLELSAVLERYKALTPFASISDPVSWQQGMRDEW